LCHPITPPSCSPRQAARARPGRDLVACAVTRSTRKAAQAHHRRPPVRRCRRAAGRLNSGPSALLPLTSRQRRCPTSRIQQQGRNNAIIPPRTHRPNRHCRRTSSACASLRPAEPPSRSYKETPSLSTAPRTLSLASQGHHRSRPAPSSVLAQRKVALVGTTSLFCSRARPSLYHLCFLYFFEIHDGKS
jgi:hypothetical protein